MKIYILPLLFLSVTSSFAGFNRCLKVRLDPLQKKGNEEYLYISKKDFNNGNALRCVKECKGFVTYSAFEQISQKSIDSIAMCDGAYNKYSWTHKFLNKKICNNKVLKKYFDEYDSLDCSNKINKDYTDAVSSVKKLCNNLYKTQASFEKGFAVYPGNASVAIMPNSLYFKEYSNLITVLEDGMKRCKLQPLQKIDTIKVSTKN